MIPDPTTALQALQNARQSIASGDRHGMRRWAERAVTLDPALEEAWLILAAVASPRASIAYLERALALNPASEQAKKGLEWAYTRLAQDGQTPEKAETSPVHTLRSALQRPAADAAPTQPHRSSAPVPAATRPLILRRQPRLNPAAPVRQPPPTRALAKFRWSLVAPALLLVCLLAVALFLPGNASTALAFLRGPDQAPLSGAPAGVDKPTYTSTFTPSSTPTATFTSTPTFTATFTATNTPLPTQTFTSTPRPLPTNTPFQPATAVPYPTVDVYDGTRWIDVDLSQQMLYAYEGNDIVASFLVSTGVAAYPTVVGKFHVYMKFEATLMAGPGYYLPDVPYTMYFYKGYGIHGTYWHNNFGTPMSHGCVNMYTPDAQWLFYWAPMGILVNVHY